MKKISILRNTIPVTALLFSMLQVFASGNEPVLRFPLSTVGDTSGAKLIAEINLLKNKDGASYVYADQEGVVIFFKNEHVEYVTPIKWADISSVSFHDATSLVFVTDFKVLDYHLSADTKPIYTFKGKKYGQYSKNPTKEKFAFARGENGYLRALNKLLQGVLEIKFPSDDDDFDF